MTKRSSKSKQGGGADYSVGYGRPPLKSRFKPGVSGNPSGYSKEIRSIKQELQSVFLRKITVYAGSRRRRRPAVVVLLQTILNNALKGDGKAALAAYKLAEELGVLNVKDTATLDVSALTAEEHELCDKAAEILRRARLIDRYDQPRGVTARAPEERAGTVTPPLLKLG